MRFRVGSLAKRSGASATENIIKAMKSRSVSMRHERLSTDFDVITIFIVFLFLSRRRVEARLVKKKKRMMESVQRLHDAESERSH